MGQVSSYARIYATADGNSHFEDVPIVLEAVQAMAITPTMMATKPLAAQEFNFRHMPQGADSDWHGAPRKQFVIIIDGTVEITASDGEVRLFTPATMFLADDMAGKHKTRHVDGDALIVTVPLAG